MAAHQRSLVPAADRFPRDFGFRLSRLEFADAFPDPKYRARSGGREPWVYSLAGLLQHRRIGGGDEVVLIRYLVAILARWPGPMPPALDLPAPPQDAVSYTAWAGAWAGV